MGNATDTTAQAWMRENRKMQAMATELVEILYNMYNNGWFEKLCKITSKRRSNSCRIR